MRHCVYPFNGTKETRRTLVCNVDVNYKSCNILEQVWDRGVKTNDTKNAKMATYVATTTQPIFTPEAM